MQMAVLLISHDLGIVAEMADHVAVMYAGEIVENAPAADIYRDPKHPYTRGLFASLPSRQQRGKDLVTLEGIVPDPRDWPAGCRFAARCPSCFEPCPTVHPVLGAVDGDQQARCLLYDESWPEGARKQIPAETRR
jgi:peptide/nickel transport system ATP-binding protein